MYGDDGRDVGFIELKFEALAARLDKSEICRDMRFSARVLCIDRADCGPFGEAEDGGVKFGLSSRASDSFGTLLALSDVSSGYHAYSICYAHRDALVLGGSELLRLRFYPLAIAHFQNAHLFE